MNSDFTSKDTSLYSWGICTSLITSIKFSVDCSLRFDLDNIRSRIASTIQSAPTLRHLLTNVKDKDEPNNRQGAIYKIECSDCQASYIGETGRNLNTRLTEHKRATRNGDVNNHISEHHRQTNHRIDWDSAKCLTYSTNYFQRLTLESWFTNLEQTPLNRCQQLPAPYKQLINDVNKPFNRPDFITSSTDNYSSLDSEDDFRTGCRNISHQQQFFSELHSPGRSHYTNYLNRIVRNGIVYVCSAVTNCNIDTLYVLLLNLEKEVQM